MACEGRLPCEECRRAYVVTTWDKEEEKERKSDGPPCWACRPEIYPENEEAVEIYSHCSGQWICGASGVVDLNIGTALQVMDVFEVDDKKSCLMGVKQIAQVQLAKWREEREEQESKNGH
ncbi:DUF1799 domain-containing protein [Maridesulfovibrio ferrireducens]|uniref:DUF1799 domain-containing protein n=1 Tax=Maridesulfovibrio ferrireducens TaxID=246191 RepID=UPI001A23B90F|nr:DUF1799 domain-containing protein [Maridesulfovibrio ferrireducens]MBI9110299.1 DUF1799 domain-containing protein [Maridesulfovibrio ferrireducens]